MTIVQQLTPYTCGLACIESICADFGRDGRQEKLLRDFKNELLAGARKYEEFGSTSPQMECHFLTQLGFTLERCVRDHRPEVQQETFEKIDLATQAILISANFHLQSRHCVRFAGMKDTTDTMLVMEPSLINQSKIAEYSIADLIKWDYSFCIFS